MSNQYYNFCYDPVRQGFDANTWATITGTPTLANNKLVLEGAGILHFADILRGDAVFSINISAPAAGDDKKWGFAEYNKGAHLYFKVADDVFSVESSDGTTTKTTDIDWVSDWSDTNTEFRIKWEAGMATFYVGGQLKATLNDTYALGVPTIAIPGDPMYLYAASDSSQAMKLNYIDVKGVQSSNLDVPTA